MTPETPRKIQHDTIGEVLARQLGATPAPSPYNAATGGVTAGHRRGERVRTPWAGEDTGTVDAHPCPRCGHVRTLYKKPDGTLGPCAECDPTCGDPFTPAQGPAAYTRAESHEPSLDTCAHCGARVDLYSTPHGDYCLACILALGL